MYWIKERYNPQFDRPYYVALGSISAHSANERIKPLYGSNYLLKFSTKQEYEAKLAELKDQGFNVTGG
jgi:hypothetical protein